MNKPKQASANDNESLYQDIDSSFYDRQAYSINPLRRWFHANRYIVINNLIQSNIGSSDTRILDLGCGSCNWNVDGIRVFGVDLNEKLLKLAKSKCRLIDYRAGDILDTQLQDNSFDIVVASEILEHSCSPLAVVSQIQRVLKPSGVAIVSVPYDTAFSLWRYLFFMQVFLHGYIFRSKYYRRKCGHVLQFSPKSLKEIFLSQDFDVELIFSMRRLSIFLVARKKGDPQASSIGYSDLTIICPTLNEAKNIGYLLGSLLSKYKGARIIVSDDGSVDGTGEIVKGFNSRDILFFDRAGATVHGLCASVFDAIKLVKSKFFVVLDADGQHPPEKISDLVNQLRLGKKLVVASRVGVSGPWPLMRKMVSYIGTFLGKCTFLLRGNHNLSYDILSGFFGAEVSFWNDSVNANGKAGSFRFRGYKVLFDFLKIVPKKINFGEAYYIFYARKIGGSKINFSVCLEYLKAVLS